ncbi:MAG: hypothetical protein GC182_19100 [Rhodopseudomonas sp.]|nr:hypothetical protein [Rhodopseudomonas sp.]
MKRNAMVGDLVSLVLAGWLFLSPWIVGYTALTAASWVAWLAGLAIVAVAALALKSVRIWTQWTNLVLGLILVASPFALHMLDKVHATDCLFQTGIVVVIIAVLELGVLYSIREPATA